jgi:hypothetical protein
MQGGGMNDEVSTEIVDFASWICARFLSERAQLSSCGSQNSLLK